MKRLIPFLVWLMAPGLLSAQFKSDPQQELAFTHVTVIDTRGGAPQSDATVVISGNRIVAIGESGKLKIPHVARTVDGTGKFLIPGLWDMHVHWYKQDYLPLFIANGVTGIRVMWGMPLNHQWRKEIAAGQLLGPHMLIASSIVDGPKPFWPGSIAVANTSEGRQAVLESKQGGADFIKVYSLLPRDAYFAIADEAKKQGIPFEGHVPIAVSVEEASNAGQKTVEHLTGVLDACSSHEAELLKASQDTLSKIIDGQKPPLASFTGPNYRKLQELVLASYSQSKAKALFAELKHNHTWQSPTLTVLRSMGFMDQASFTNDPRLKYMPPDVKSSWDPKAGFYQQKTAEDWALSKKIYRKDLEVVGAMQRAGVEILAGTDTLNPYCFPGFSLHDELGLLVQSGLTPMQALQAATLSPARFMGREKDLGTIEPGKLADMVLLDANPLADISNTKRIDAVILGGKVFDRTSLDAMLTKIEALASRKSIAEVLSKTLEKQDVQAAIKQYYELKATAPTAYVFDEDELDGLGYQLLQSKKVKDAIRILELNVEAYPSSYNVYDSLGDAYFEDGKKDRAIENYRKSLELSPENASTADKLKKLTARPD